MPCTSSIKIGKLQLLYNLDHKSESILINENVSALKVDIGLPLKRIFQSVN